ncbi:hypothetical protein AOCH_004259 [Aspergillus ochraceoroseus]|uniref:Condensation domain-containing protein n=1 Tax=Aspergillus ochraceoroseus TaxID=138278 RepID=A0A0F8WBT9_9EURO|nr:hypothetical protein AOCH_004259 [Aspergillus ochraceoroseus]
MACFSNSGAPLTICPAPEDWHQKDQTQYVRPFDGFEKLFHSFCRDPLRPGFRSLDVFVNILIETDKKPENVVELAKKAWIRMRLLHPLIGAKVQGDEFQYTAVSDPSTLHEWLDETFIVRDSETSLCTGEVQDLDVVPPTPGPILYYFPAEQRFVFRADHMFMDGHGMAILFQDFFREMERLDGGGKLQNDPRREEVQYLPPGAMKAAMIDDLGGESNRTWSENLARSIPQVQSTREAVEIPSANGALDPGVSRVQCLGLSEEQTRDLLATAKRARLGLTPFLHAAFLHAGQKMSASRNPSGESTTHSTFLIFNLRDQCAGLPLNGTSRAVALRIGYWPVQVEIADNLSRTASALREEYVNLAQHKRTAISAMVPYFRESMRVLGERHYYQGILPSFIGNFSDKVSDRYGAFGIREFWALVIPTDERVYLGIQTFRNRLFIRVSYNSVYHDDEQIAKYLRLIMQEIQHGLSQLPAIL